jgi:hypothetical protein
MGAVTYHSGIWFFAVPLSGSFTCIASWIRLEARFSSDLSRKCRVTLMRESGDGASGQQ